MDSGARGLSSATPTRGSPQLAAPLKVSIIGKQDGGNGGDRGCDGGGEGRGEFAATCSGDPGFKTWRPVLRETVAVFDKTDIDLRHSLFHKLLGPRAGFYGAKFLHLVGATCGLRWLVTCTFLFSWVMQFLLLTEAVDSTTRKLWLPWLSMSNVMAGCAALGFQNVKLMKKVLSIFEAYFITAQSTLFLLCLCNLSGWESHFSIYFLSLVFIYAGTTTLDAFPHKQILLVQGEKVRQVGHSLL